jgi:hypothetical protein
MLRRRSAPHTFEDNIATEKAKLEAQLASLNPGPQMDAQSWSRMSEQNLRVDKWSVCRG